MALTRFDADRQPLSGSIEDQGGGEGGDVESLLKGRVAVFKVPERWQAFDTLPLTGSGKVQKFKLRELFAAAEQADG